MGGSRRVAVAGANGKTTTTSLLTVALQACGVDPSFAVGGELAKHGTNAHLGTGDIFVVEADESDGSFLVYRPEVAIVTNVQPDHLDFYGDLATVRGGIPGLRRARSPRAACSSPAPTTRGARRSRTRARSAAIRVLTYGESPDADVRLSDEVHRGLAWSARRDRWTAAEPRAVGCSSPGHHNVLNATAAFAAATAGLGQDPRAGARRAGVLHAARGAGSSRRVARPGSSVVDDYAHNAGKVAAVVGTATQLVEDAGSGRLVVVFQPHLYSRTRDFAAELGAGLAPADVVVVMDVYAAREDPQPGVSGRLVAEAVPGGAGGRGRALRAVLGRRAGSGASGCSGPATCSSRWGPAT